MVKNKRSNSLRKQKTQTPTFFCGVMCALSCVVFIFCLTPLGLLFSDALSTTLQTFVSPFTYVASLLQQPFSIASQGITNATADQRTYSDLLQENEELKAENASLQAAQKEAQDLANLLGFVQSTNLQTIGADVILLSQDSAYSSITVNKGSLAGVELGMCVTSASGVIGQVSAVTPSTATVRLITDERSSVAAITQQGEAQGQLKGTGSSELQFDFVSVDDTVQPGDTLLTSGLDGIYPAGLPLGSITSVDKSQSSLYYDISASPFLNFSGARHVLIITGEGN